MGFEATKSRSIRSGIVYYYSFFAYPELWGPSCKPPFRRATSRRRGSGGRWGGRRRWSGRSRRSQGSRCTCCGGCGSACGLERKVEKEIDSVNCNAHRHGGSDGKALSMALKGCMGVGYGSDLSNQARLRVSNSGQSTTK